MISWPRCSAATAWLRWNATGLPDAVTTALAISRDTALSGGDALSEDTRDLLRDTSGGAVFYHIYAPDGVFVTGYATPPVPPSMACTADGQTYFDAIYQSEPVRMLRLVLSDKLDGFAADPYFC